MKHPTTRRCFLQSTLAGASGLLILPCARTALAYRANERLRLAVVGMAGYGAYHGFGQGIHTYGNVGYAVSCDVDLRKVKRVYDVWEQRAAQWANSPKEEERKAAAEYYGPLAAKKPPLLADFRRIFDEAADQFDAVVVATPDHTHSIIAAAWRSFAKGSWATCVRSTSSSAGEGAVSSRPRKGPSRCPRS